MSKKPTRRDQPLVCRVEGEELVIRIGIGTLAFSAEHCPKFFDEAKFGVTGPPYKSVEDADELASDVVAKLNYEEEDGTTPLHTLLDDAIYAAWEDGSIAFAEEDNTDGDGDGC